MSAIKPRTAVVDIYQGDYLARLRDLEQRHKAALIAEKSGTTLRNDEIPESQVIADEHAAVKLEAERGQSRRDARGAWPQGVARTRR
ncbi:hypothetical protein [Aeromicrobium sp. UC242_57]|uniref:hypothetical protein n=1 Tax=Aeromicrobium sp. UC242_57 TaxID=3374624 RepID=UPI00379D0360